MGKVKEIEGKQSENTEQNKSDRDNGSDGNKADEKKIDSIVNKKDNKILNLEHDEVKVVDEEMNENYDIMMNKTQNNYDDESDDSNVIGEIDKKEMEEIDKQNDMMNKIQKNKSDASDETDRKEIKDNTMGLRIGNDETEMVDEENNDRRSKNTKENKNNAPYTSFKKVIFEVIGIKLLFQILFVNHLA